MKPHAVRCLLNRIIIATFLPLFIASCADEQFLTEAPYPSSATTLSTNTTGISVTESDCHSCTYVVPSDNNIIDGIVLGLKPGDVIGLNANISYGNLIFRNIVGTPESPIIIKNCGGVARIDGTGKHDAIKTEKSKYFRITGGTTDNVYGIKVNAGHMSVNLGGLSTNFEVDHLEITNSGFAGIIAKTDPGCNELTWRDNFLMSDVKLHHNSISNTGGEGIYAGNSFFLGMNTPCGVQLPHEIHNIQIYNNVLTNTGWDAIQLGCATKDASIFGNVIENYGTANETAQNNAIQIGAGTGGLCYNNLIRIGTGNGLIVMGLGDNIIYNNIIEDAGSHGIFCDERYSPGPGFKFINNTILNPKGDGIRIYAELVPMNAIVNNIIANPGNYSAYSYPRSPSDAFVFRLNKDVKIEMASNYFTTVTDSLRIINLAEMNYRVDPTSPVIDGGSDISPYCAVSTDFYNESRLRGARYDIGAVENTPPPPPNVAPTSNAGRDLTLTLPMNTVTLAGAATDPDGSIVSYRWTQYGGTPVNIVDSNTATATVMGLAEGKYYFKLTVTDDVGAVDDDNILVMVVSPVEPLPEEDIQNAAPTANAGRDLTLDLPENSIVLQGSGADKDGSIVSYQWTQYGGPAAEIVGANSAVATVKVFDNGKYYFRLTVQDDDGATHYDNMLLVVTGEYFPNVAPVAEAGRDYLFTQPVNSLALQGKGTDIDGSVISYTWTQYGGTAIAVENANTPTPTLRNLQAGKYYFRLTVEDDDGATDYDNILINILMP